MEEIKKFFRELFGYTYLLNTRTGETHNTHNYKKRCGILHPRNRKYITYKKFRKLKGTSIPVINGCKWCMPKYDI